jgi:hypothetical protein
MVVGHTYRMSFYVKSGTSGAEAFYGNFSGAGFAGSVVGTSSSSWTPYSFTEVAGGTSALAVLGKNTTTAGTMLFDRVSVVDLGEAGHTLDRYNVTGNAEHDSLGFGYNITYSPNFTNPIWENNTTNGADAGTVNNPVMQGSATWNPGSLGDGVGETSASITATGAALGDFVLVSAPYDLQGITCNGYVDAAGSVKIRLQNETTGTIDLASGTWKVKVIRS